MSPSWIAYALAALQALAAPAEPDVPPPLELHIPPGLPGERLQINFPAQAHAGESRGTYWLTGDERVVADVQLSVDLDRKDPVRVIGAAVIDGVQVPVRTAGHAASRTVERLVVPGQVDRFQVSVDAGHIAVGTHWAALLFWQADGQRFPGWSFAIVKDGSSRPRARAGNPFRVGSAELGELRISLRRPAERLLYGRAEPLRPLADGSAAFDVRLAEAPGSDAASARTHTLIALLDGAQVPFGWATAAPTVELSPGSAADARLTVRRLPASEDRHLLLLFLVTRERPSPEGVADTGSDWHVVPPRQVGGLVW